IQEKKTFNQGDLFVDNQFDGARVNGLSFTNDSTIKILITPENEPINRSPWYAFRAWTSENSKTVSVTIDYNRMYKHRYWPKISDDRRTWARIDESSVSLADDTLSLTFSFEVSPDTTWISAQPLETSQDVKAWSQEIAKNKTAAFDVIGKSRMGRDLFHIKLGTGKKTVVLISRQHPPEVTGYYALKAFVGKLADDSKLSKSFLKKYTVHIYPLLNPDGVDMGHWRHNTGGVDLNRDWAYYKQPEIKQIADHIVRTVKEGNSEVAAGLDFHSTYYDVYYTTSRNLETNYASFTDDWLSYIRDNIEGYEINDQPSGLGSPVSKGWFITQFNVPGITFEIGDDTPPEFIQKKGKISAEGMMKVLLRSE
ncbi:MAG: M14 family metallopeptidase, partial [Cyclobacteriaceae bacterium]